MTDSSITVTWIPGYNGGHQQTFHLQYRVSGSDEWKLVDIPNNHKEEQSDLMSYTLTELQDETLYELRMYAVNKFNSSLHTQIIEKQTSAAKGK